MSNIFDSVLEEKSPDALGDTGMVFYDADTLYDSEGQGYRLKGVNAFEVDQLGKDGQIGGQLSKEQVVKLANELGYTNVVETGDYDTTGGKRKMVDLQDNAGRSFSRELAASGMAPIDPRFDEGGSLWRSREMRQAMRSSENYNPTEFDLAADVLSEHLQNNNEYQALFKQKRLLPGMQGDIYTESGALFEKRGIDTKTGESTTPLSTAWDTAMHGVAEAAYGILDLMGEKLGIDYLENVGEAGVHRKRFKIGQQGTILTDYKDVEGFGDAMSYLGNNMVMSLPYMAITGLAMLAAPATGGASMLAPVSVYTGQTWNEMGDHAGEDGKKSATLAIASGVLQAALDRVGLGGVLKASGAPKQVYSEAVAALMAKGLSKEAAEETFSVATKKEIAKFLKDAGTSVSEQLRHRDLALATLQRAAQGAGSESVTEAMQESIAAIAADLGTTGVIDWRDVSDRAIQGAIAGGAIGGAFSAAGGVKDAGAWQDVMWKTSSEDPKSVSQSAIYAREAEEEKGYVPSHQENIAEARRLPEAVEQGKDRAARHEEKLKRRGFKESLKDMGKGFLEMFPRQTSNLGTDEQVAKSVTLRKLKDMVGGFSQKIYNGPIFENFKQHIMTKYKNSMGDTDNLYVELNEGKPVSRADKIILSNEFYKTVQAAQDAKGNLDPNKIPEVSAGGLKKATVLGLVKKLDALANMMYNDQKNHNKDLGKINNYLLTYKSLDKGAVSKKRDLFIKRLKEVYGLDHKTATALTDEIINGQSNSAGEAFSLVKGGFTPGAHRKKSFRLSEKKEFQEFMEQDLLANAANAAKSAARYVSYQNYFGNNNSNLDKMYDQMQREGLTQEEVDEIAFRMKNYIDSESGNYKRPTTELGKRLEAVQKNFMLFSTLTGLSLATMASLPELALSVLGLSNKQIFGPKGSLSSMAHEFANMIYKGMMEVAHVGQKKGKVTRDTVGTKMISDAGYYAWDVGAATITGVTETHAWHQRILENFFKWTGLQGWTNFTRATRAAMAGDYIVENAMIIMKHPEGEPKTNEVREAEDKLRNLGIDITRKLPQITRAFKTMNLPADQKTEGMRANEEAVSHVIKDAVFNFVNDAVVMPMSYNRPLIYQDPRFALFTQFQGFMSAFTANQIPKMWNEYIRNGSPQMKYNTFAIMMTMIMLGFASQYLKDLIKFGKSSPYLDEAEYFRRGFQSSGLLGTAERGLDFMFPIYETRTGNAGEWAFEKAVGESPTLSKAVQLGGAGADFIRGDTDRAGAKLASATMGPLRHSARTAGDWLFDGE